MKKANTNKVTESVAAYTPPPPPKGKLAKVARRPRPEPEHEDPFQELRRLAKLHANWTRTSVAFHHMRTDRKVKATGDTIPCLLPATTRADLALAEERLRAADEGLKWEMERALKKTRIWKEWLKGVAGIGEVTAAQLVAEIDINRAVKASNLKMFLGVCPDERTGRLVRREKGHVNRYNARLRTVIYSAWTSIRKNAHPNKHPPFGRTSKYFDIWQQSRAGAINDPRYNPKDNTWTRLKPDGTKEVHKGALGFIDKRGMWKSIDIFVEDLYMVWRAMEGLPVWPDWYAAKLGYMHGGKIAVREPRIMTLEEAIEMVGDVGWRDNTAMPLAPAIEEEDGDEDGDEVAAE